MYHRACLPTSMAKAFEALERNATGRGSTNELEVLSSDEMNMYRQQFTTNTIAEAKLHHASPC